MRSIISQIYILCVLGPVMCLAPGSNPSCDNALIAKRLLPLRKLCYLDLDQRAALLLLIGTAVFREDTMIMLNHSAAAAVFAVAALLAGEQGAAAQVTLGAVLSVTGPASFLGDPEKKTLEIYVQEINAKGGVNGEKLQLIVYDDAGNANNARTFATRLVEEDKIVAMVEQQ